jgi:hypothetical protein
METAMNVSKADRERWRKAEDVERRLIRKVRIWAQTWKRCPKKGCRRAGKCLRFDRCAGLPAGPPTWPTEEVQRWFRDMIDKEKMRRGLAPSPGYDPDQRDRDALLPPGPESPRLSSRPSPTGESRDPEP